jgi:hypothetical protein
LSEGRSSINTTGKGGGDGVLRVVPAIRAIIAADDMHAQDGNDDCLAEDLVMS